MATKRETELDAKTTIVDADSIRILNSADSSDSETITYANFKTKLTADGIGGTASPHDPAGSYTILDDDGYTHIIDSATGTITLPTLADNYNRTITIIRDVADSDTGLIVDGEGAETISGRTTWSLYGRYGTMTLMASEDAGEWVFVGNPVDEYEVSLTSDTLYTQASPVSLTWYHLGSSSIGAFGASGETWDIGYYATIRLDGTNIDSLAADLSLSSAAEGSDGKRMWYIFNVDTTNSTTLLFGVAHKEERITLAGSTTYYLNLRGQGTSLTNLRIRGDLGRTYIYARQVFK